jgi:hypothetical protein
VPQGWEKRRLDSHPPTAGRIQRDCRADLLTDSQPRTPKPKTPHRPRSAAATADERGD